MTDDKAGQARKGLIDSVKGKAKEVAGAIIGNDSLTAEGQLEQTQAQERREANSAEAVADAQAQRAAEEATEARIEGSQERIEAEAQAAAAEATVRRQQAVQKQSADEAAQRDVARANQQAEAQRRHDAVMADAQEHVDVRAAQTGLGHAVDDFAESAVDAQRKQAEADRLRRQVQDGEGH